MSHDDLTTFPRGRSKRISQLVGNPTILSGGFLTFVGQDGVNYKISFSDFISNLGVTGSISQAGEPLATPVLAGTPTDFLIRNLENGPGVKASISPLNGITLEHNFTVGEVGNPMMLNPTAISPTLPSLIAGTGVGIAAGTDSYTISATGAVTPTNVVIINQESDFPIQSSTIITLSENIIYVIGSSFSTSKRFVGERGFVMTMGNQFGDVLTYTGTEAMFTCDFSCTIEKITLDSPSASMTFTGSNNTNTQIFITREVTVNNTPKWATFSGFLTTAIEFCNSPNADDGITVGGSGQVVLSIMQFAIATTSASCRLIELGSAIIPNIELSDLILIGPPGAVMVSGAASSGNLPAGSLGLISGSSVSGGASPLSGITSDDIRWVFNGNAGISNTRPDGLTSLVDNVTQSIIAASSDDGSNAVKVVGVWGIESSSHFTVSTDGRITYNGETPFTAPVDGSINGRMASGSTKNIAAYIAINGSVIRATEAITNVSNTAAGAMSVHWQHTFEEGDFAEIFVENQSDATNIIAISGVGRIN